MKDNSFAKEQSKMLIKCSIGILMVAIPAEWARPVNWAIGLMALSFASIIFYRELIQKNSIGVKEVLVSIALAIVFFAAGIMLLVNAEDVRNIICVTAGIFTILLGISDLIEANETVKIYIAVVFSIAGTMVLFSPNRTDASVAHVCGLYVCYYSVSSYLREKFG